MTEAKIERSVPQQVRRAKAVVNHVNRMEPAMREWLIARLRAEECSIRTCAKLRAVGYR